MVIITLSWTFILILGFCTRVKSPLQNRVINGVALLKVSKQRHLPPATIICIKGNYAVTFCIYVQYNYILIVYIQSGQFCPLVYLLNVLNQVTSSPIIQPVYLKKLFIQINMYTIFTRQQVYLVTICSTMNLQFPSITESDVGMPPE